MKILRESYQINAVAVVDRVEKFEQKHTQEGFAVLFNKTYLPRTIVAIVIHIAVAFQYTTIAFFLPSILTRFFHTDTLTTITTTLGLNLVFAFTGGLLGVFVASRFSSRHVLLAGFALQFIALVALSAIGDPSNSFFLYGAIFMLGLWLFAEGFGPGAQMMVYPTMAYPASIRGVGVGFNRAVTGVAQAIALFVLPIWMANYKTDVFLLVSIFAIVPIIVIGFLIKFEPTKHDVDAIVENKTPQGYLGTQVAD